MTKSERHQSICYSSPSSSSSLSGSPKCSTWPERCPGKTQWGPLASIETSATSHGRARYATATQPHGSPSSASNSKTVGGLACLSTVVVVIGFLPYCQGSYAKRAPSRTCPETAVFPWSLPVIVTGRECLLSGPSRVNLLD